MHDATHFPLIPASMRARALPSFSCNPPCTSPEFLHQCELVQEIRRSARLPAVKRRKCTPKSEFEGQFDVHFPAFLARN